MFVYTRDNRRPPHWTPYIAPNNRFIAANSEPSLDELMSDPIFDLVMKRDQLTTEDVMAVVSKHQKTFASRL